MIDSCEYIIVLILIESIKKAKFIRYDKNGLHFSYNQVFIMFKLFFDILMNLEPSVLQCLSGVV